MRRLCLLTLQAPAEDVERIMGEVARLAPLTMGNYDSNACQSGPGIVEVSFELPDDQEFVERVIEAIIQAHSYQEPVIRLRAILASRSKEGNTRTMPGRENHRELPVICAVAAA